MATSPNYGWSEPDNTSLVKDGAQAMRTLGDAIDTSVWNVGFGQAGKNKIINGDFFVNQRSFTTTSTDTAFTFDRWQVRQDTGTVSATAQTFTAGAAPVAGYESKNFIRLSGSGQTVAGAQLALQQPIESVRTFAGQTITVSFWAKAGSGTPKIALQLQQIFGSGGSATVNTYGGQVTLSTSWARYSLTVAVPSVSGKTISSSNDDKLTVKLYCSAGTNFDAVTGSLGIQSGTFDFWGVQVEAGSIATPFQTASGGSIQGELAMCQRYYEKTYPQATAPATASQAGMIGPAISSSAAAPTYLLEWRSWKVEKRATPTVTFYDSAGNINKCSVYSTGATPSDNQGINIDSISATSGRIYIGGGYAGFFYHYTASAEL